MGLEQAVLDNTAAVKALTEAVLASNAGRDAAVEKLAAGEGQTTSRRGRSPKEKTDAPAVDAPKADTQVPAVETSKAPVVEQVKAETPAPINDAAVNQIAIAPTLRDAVLAFADVPDANTRAERKEFLRAAFNHLGGTKVSEVPVEHHTMFQGWLVAKARGEDVNFSAGEDDQDEDMFS